MVFSPGDLPIAQSSTSGGQVLSKVFQRIPSSQALSISHSSASRQLLQVTSKKSPGFAVSAGGMGIKVAGARLTRGAAGHLLRNAAIKVVGSVVLHELMRDFVSLVNDILRVPNDAVSEVRDWVFKSDLRAKVAVVAVVQDFLVPLCALLEHLLSYFEYVVRSTPQRYVVCVVRNLVN